jgi:hypothetical protein
MHPARLIREPLHHLAGRNCINVNLLTSSRPIRSS